MHMLAFMHTHPYTKVKQYWWTLGASEALARLIVMFLAMHALGTVTSSTQAG